MDLKTERDGLRNEMRQLRTENDQQAAENERLRAALEACRQHVRRHYNSSSWFNDPAVWRLVKDHIDPALGTRSE